MKHESEIAEVMTKVTYIEGEIKKISEVSDETANQLGFANKVEAGSKEGNDNPTLPKITKFQKGALISSLLTILILILEIILKHT